MSKYRITFTPALWRRWAFLLPVAALAVNGLLYSPNFWTWIQPAEYAAGVLAVALWLGIWQCVCAEIPAEVFWVAQNGDWQTLMVNDVAVEMPQYQLLPGSRVTPLALYVQLSEHSQPKGRERQGRWIFKGECQEADFRRLARIIHSLNGLPERDVYL